MFFSSNLKKIAIVIAIFLSGFTAGLITYFASTHTIFSYDGGIEFQSKQYDAGFETGLKTQSHLFLIEVEDALDQESSCEDALRRIDIAATTFFND